MPRQQMVSPSTVTSMAIQPNSPASGKPQSSNQRRLPGPTRTAGESVKRRGGTSPQDQVGDGPIDHGKRPPGGNIEFSDQELSADKLPGSAQVGCQGAGNHRTRFKVHHDLLFRKHLASHQVVAQRSVPSFAQAAFVEHATTDCPGAAPNQVIVSLARGHPRDRAVDAVQEPGTPGVPDWHEPAVAGHRADRFLIEPAHHRPQPVARRAGVGIGKGQHLDIGFQILGCGPQVVYFLTGIGCPSGDHQPCRRAGVRVDQLLNRVAGRIVGALDHERHAVIGIVLLQERAEVFFQADVDSLAGNDQFHARPVVELLVRLFESLAREATMLPVLQRAQHRLHERGSSQDVSSDRDHQHGTSLRRVEE